MITTQWDSSKHRMNKIQLTTSAIISIITILLVSPATASTLDALDDATYISQDDDTAGWVKLKPATGGAYVISRSEEGTKPKPVFIMIGKPEQTDYVFLTAQEQESIWHYREDKLEEIRKASLPPPPEKKQPNKLASMKWPHVIVKGNKVCVPDLFHNDSPDWQDHMTCTYLGDTHVK
jgi:hypothetical protein